MPSFTETKFYLLGLWLLVKGDKKGFGYLDLTDRGMMRSFWAIVWCLPAIALSWIWWRMAYSQGMPFDTSPRLLFFFRMAMLEAANWLAPLLLAGSLAWALGIGRLFPAIVFTANWISLPFSYLYGLLSLLLMVTPRLSSVLALVWLAAIIALVVCLSRIFRAMLGAQPLMIATLTMVLIVPSLLLSDMLERFLGVYPG